MIPMQLSYIFGCNPIRKSDNSVETICVRHEEDLLLEELQMLCCPSEDMSEIIVQDVSNPKRTKRPCETHIEANKKHLIIVGKYYEKFVTIIAAEFISKSRA